MARQTTEFSRATFLDGSALLGRQEEPSQEEKVYQDVDPESITIGKESVLVVWPFRHTRFVYTTYRRAQTVNDLLPWTWIVDARGNIFVRCPGCRAIIGFDQEGIHPTGVARPHRDPRYYHPRTCHLCPRCEVPLLPYFEGWKEWNKNEKKTSSGGPHQPEGMNPS